MVEKEWLFNSWRWQQKRCRSLCVGTCICIIPAIHSDNFHYPRVNVTAAATVGVDMSELLFSSHSIPVNKHSYCFVEFELHLFVAINNNWNLIMSINTYHRLLTFLIKFLCLFFMSSHNYWKSLACNWNSSRMQMASAVDFWWRAHPQTEKNQDASSLQEKYVSKSKNFRVMKFFFGVRRHFFIYFSKEKAP